MKDKRDFFVLIYRKVDKKLLRYKAYSNDKKNNHRNDALGRDCFLLNRTCFCL